MLRAPCGYKPTNPRRAHRAPSPTGAKPFTSAGSYGDQKREVPRTGQPLVRASENTTLSANKLGDNKLNDNKLNDSKLGDNKLGDNKLGDTKCWVTTQASSGLPRSCGPSRAAQLTVPAVSPRADREACKAIPTELS